jgi:hypothetical protein
MNEDVMVLFFITRIDLVFIWNFCMALAGSVCMIPVGRLA